MHVQVSDFIPFLSWIRTYGRRHIKADLLAGLTVAVVAVPQCMAYALIAGLPIQYGLYAAIVPAIIGSLWGSSAQLITGPTTAISLVVFSTLIDLAPAGSSHYVELAFFLALLVGIVQILMGIARLGSLLNFVSHSVILGFTAGAAVLIAFKQIPNLLGLHLEKSKTFVESLVRIAQNLNETHLITLALGALTVVLIVIIKKLRPSFPGTLIALVVVGGIVALWGLDKKGVSVVGNIPRTLPPFHLPQISMGSYVANLAPRSSGHCHTWTHGGGINCQVHCRSDAPAARRQPGVCRSGPVQCGGLIVQRLCGKWLFHPFGGQFSLRRQDPNERSILWNCCGGCDIARCSVGLQVTGGRIGRGAHGGGIRYGAERRY